MIQAVGEALKASIQPLIDLANYGSTPQAAIDSFFADLSYVLTKTAAEAARWEATALTAAEGLAETAQKVGKALQAAAVGLSAGEKGIGAYEAIDRATVDAFFADLDYVVQKTIVTAALFTAQGLSAALDFALTAQEIGKALKDTAGGLKKVLDEVGADFQEKISAFLGGVAAIVQAVVTAATQGGQALASARDLAAHMAGIVSIITQAAADFARLAGSLGGGTSYDLGMGVGAGFISGIIAGINSLLPDLGAVLAYLASLFPHSPAERGPLAEPVDWQSYLTGGLSDALAGLRADLTPALVPVTEGGMGGGRSSGGQVINVTISGNNFRDRSDIDYTLDAMTRKLRLQGVIP
ncbi:MAG: hypothetical protein FJW34_24650 [Acidobacteria bacterium]|nr:hypothetical protein [Acidobacteriota bacterium]